MGLEDFEKQLVEEKAQESQNKHGKSHRDRDENWENRHRHRHHHRSHRHRDDEERRRRHKRHREGEDDDSRKHRKRLRSESPSEAAPEKADKEVVKVFDSDNEDGEDEWVEKEAATAPPEEEVLDQRDQDVRDEKVHRDAWMQEPSALDIDYMSRKKPKSPPGQFVGAKKDHGFKVHETDVNQHLVDLQRDFHDSDEGDRHSKKNVEDEPAQHSVSYTFGDAGSSWRMTKLKAIYRQADESGRSVDDVALERYGDLRDFDDAREEEREMDRRKMYGREYVGLEKPSGEFFQERKMGVGLRRSSSSKREDGEEGDARESLPAQGTAIEDPSSQPQPTKTAPLDPTSLNKLKAQMMKARLRNAPNAAQLEEEYNLAEQASMANSTQSGVVVLNNMQTRHLASGRGSEVIALTGKRARERGLVEENNDMSVEDMVRQEKRSKQQQGGAGKEFAERIAKDAKFTDNLDYMDDNASNLSKKVVKSDTALRNAAIGDYQRQQKALANCPLCYHDDADRPKPPTAPVVSLATRTYLTLPPEPEIAKGGAVLVPIQHHPNLLHCDEDEWEELRNFQKSLTRHYAAQNLGVLFYENAAHTRSSRGAPHALLHAVPVPHHLAEQAPAYFKEAILSADEVWSQHKPVIDTLTLSREKYGKAAFSKSLPKEMPYFHVWTTLDGGLGHVVEDERRWPKGDGFAREVLGGMLDRGPEVVRREGKWEGGDRGKGVEGFRKKWAEFDWTKVLVEEGEGG